MTTFDQRERGFEAKFSLDQELDFRVQVRLRRLMGLWAAEKMGLEGQEAEDYAQEVVHADVEDPEDHDVVSKLLIDFGKREIDVTVSEVRKELERLLPRVRDEVLGPEEEF